MPRAVETNAHLKRLEQSETKNKTREITGYTKGVKVKQESAVTLPETDSGSQDCSICFERCKPSTEEIWKCEHCSAGLIHEWCCNADKTCHTCEKPLIRHVVSEPPRDVVDLTMDEAAMTVMDDSTNVSVAGKRKATQAI